MHDQGWKQATKRNKMSVKRHNKKMKYNYKTGK